MDDINPIQVDVSRFNEDFVHNFLTKSEDVDDDDDEYDEKNLSLLHFINAPFENEVKGSLSPISERQNSLSPHIMDLIPIKLVDGEVSSSHSSSSFCSPITSSPFFSASPVSDSGERSILQEEDDEQEDDEQEDDEQEDDEQDDDQVDQKSVKGNNIPIVCRCKKNFNMQQNVEDDGDDDDDVVDVDVVDGGVVGSAALLIKKHNKKIYDFITNIKLHVNSITLEFIDPSVVMHQISRDVFPYPGYEEIIPTIREFYINILHNIYLKNPSSSSSLEARIKLLWYSLIKKDLLCFHIPRTLDFDLDFTEDRKKEIDALIDLITTDLSAPSKEDLFWVCLTCVVVHTAMNEENPEINLLILKPLYSYLKRHTNITPEYSIDDVQMKLWNCALSLIEGGESANYRQMRSELQLQLAYIKYRQSLSSTILLGKYIDPSYLKEIKKGVLEWDNPICAWELVCIISSGKPNCDDVSSFDIEKLIEMAALGGVSEAQRLFVSSMYSPFSEALIPYKTVKITDHELLVMADLTIRMGQSTLSFSDFKNKYFKKNAMNLTFVLLSIIAILCLLLWILSKILLSKHDDLEDGAEFYYRDEKEAFDDDDEEDDDDDDDSDFDLN